MLTIENEINLYNPFVTNLSIESKRIRMYQAEIVK